MYQPSGVGGAEDVLGLSDPVIIQLAARIVRFARGAGPLQRGHKLARQFVVAVDALAKGVDLVGVQWSMLAVVGGYIPFGKAMGFSWP